MRKSLYQSCIFLCLPFMVSCSGSSTVQVAAEQLSEKYKTDENEANRQYNDKHLQIVGKIGMESNDADQVIMISPTGPAIVFQVPQSNRDQFKRKVLNKKVRIEGVCKGRVDQKNFITIEDSKLLGIEE